jgi:hypothetical protein
VRGTVTDISLNGCYVEMLSPLPLDSAVELAFKIEDSTLHVSGKVRTSQMSFGMGVVFTSMSPVDFELLRAFAPPAASPTKKGGSAQVDLKEPAPETQQQKGNSRCPHPASSERAAGEGGDAETARAPEAVVRALLRKGILSREELAQEFEKVNAGKQ